jgi:8-oxo-dGTP pyrophosphatase MutT (NUDIX family)
MTAMWPAEMVEAQAWIRQRLAGFEFDGRAGDIPWRVAGARQRPAAVLVPLVWHDSGPTVLLTRRTESLSTHAGQVSFPGGKVDASDSSVIAAALREAHEEIGLAADGVTVLGTLPQYVTITDFVVTPVVAMLQPPLQLRPEPGEVAEVFEVPLTLALDGASTRSTAMCVMACVVSIWPCSGSTTPSGVQPRPCCACWRRRWASTVKPASAERRFQPACCRSVSFGLPSLSIRSRPAILACTAACRHG